MPATLATSTARPDSTAIGDVRNELLRRVGRHWTPGERIPSIRELSAALGCSHGYAHQAVKQLVREGVFVSRERVGVFVSDQLDASEIARMRSAPRGRISPYVTQPLANLRVAMAAHGTRNDGLLVRMWDAFEQAMSQYGACLQRTELPKATTKRTSLPVSDADAVALFRPEGGPIEVDPAVPLVVVSQALPRNFAVTPASNYDVVSVDHCQGGVLAGELARQAEMRTVCFLGRCNKGHPDAATAYDELSTARLNGFESGYGTAIEPEHRLSSTTYSMSCGADMARQFMELTPRPDAVFAASDELAMGFVIGARALGLRYGRDYRIIGFDGQHIGRGLQGGPLTTIDLPCEAMGEKAAELLAERLLDMTLPIRRLHMGCTLFQGVTL